MDEPGSVALIWNQTGIAYQKAGQPEAAEDAYRQALTIWVRLGDVAGQASTLNELGNLYDDVLDRPEEAAAFYRQAADKYVEIGNSAMAGLTRSNLAETLRKLRRLIEAQKEIRRAIECEAPFGHATEPWKTWNILTNIEADAGDPVAAAAARAKAIDCYLAYRRDSGENYSDSGRLCVAVTQKILAGDSVEAMSLIHDNAVTYNTADWQAFIRALQAIVVGSRDRTLADGPDLNYQMAAEILFLIETLEKRHTPHPAQAS